MALVINSIKANMLRKPKIYRRHVVFTELCTNCRKYTKRLHLILINKPSNTIKGITQNRGIKLYKRGSYFKYYNKALHLSKMFHLSIKGLKMWKIILLIDSLFLIHLN